MAAPAIEPGSVFACTCTTKPRASCRCGTTGAGPRPPTRPADAPHRSIASRRRPALAVDPRFAGPLTGCSRRRPKPNVLTSPQRKQAARSAACFRCVELAKSADKPGSVTAHPQVRYGRHSSRRGVSAALKPPTRGLDEQPVLPNARPPAWCCSGWRLPRFTRSRVTGGDSSLWPCSSPSSAALTATYSGRALPGILLCGARTFLSPRSACAVRAATVWLASKFEFYAVRRRVASAPPRRRAAARSAPRRMRSRPGPPTKCA